MKVQYIGHSGFLVTMESCCLLFDYYTGTIPKHLKDSHYSGAKKLDHGQNYKYPHIFPNHYVKQQYLPDNIKNSVYYEYGDNKMERLTKEYWDKVKENS